MSRKSCFSFLSLVFVVLCFGAREAHACSCITSPPVDAAYERADFVVLTRVISVEKAEKAAAPGRMSDGENYVDGVKSTRMLVERVFKGSLKAGEEITFAQGGGADCIWTFSEEEIGEQFLFYLHSREKRPAIWVAITCSRSGYSKHVADDLLYLNKLERVRSKSRLAGTLGFNGDGNELSVENRRIRITGAGKTYELKTDKDGAYEIYDLPAGQYTVEPETPSGWKVNKYYLPGGSKSSKQIQVTIEAKKHTELDIGFVIDNAVRGKVYDPDGRLMEGVCLELVPAQGESPQYFSKSDCTNADGTFEIKEIPAGSYVIVVNRRGTISSTQPFKMFYHPDVSERERATVITIGAGETLADMDIRVPHAEETITVEGVLLYSDGKPVVKERVAFIPGGTKENVDGEANALTDAKGRFSLKILQGLEGELYGEMYTYSGEFENCPKLEAIVKKAGGSTEIKSTVLKIRAASDLSNVELRYSFPGCKKAKEPE
jgi:hypothetical protein